MVIIYIINYNNVLKRDTFPPTNEPKKLGDEE